MSKNENVTANRGEWSELYTLGFLLVNGGAYAADENQSRIEDLFYKVLDVYLQGKVPEEELRYKLADGSVSIYQNNQHLEDVSKSFLKTQVDVFFKDLGKKDLGPTFSLNSGMVLMNTLHKTYVSAPSSQQTSDLEIVFEDRDSKLPTPKVGFSIKSQVGSASTLLNASGATNFIYEVSSDQNFDDDELLELEPNKIAHSVSSLKERGFSFNFRKVANETFQNNLELLDSRMPEYVAEVLLASYSGGVSNFAELVEKVFPSDVRSSSQKVFKMKQFLGSIAMGMRPTQHWDGDITKFKGLIVVKTDGDVVFYYLYNINSFQEYLFNNVKFERGSTSRHQYGKFFKEEGKFFVNLNLQIRFNK
jgi:HpaII restriction endonuclease